MRVRASSGRLPKRVAWVAALVLVLACVFTMALAGCRGSSPSAEGPGSGDEAAYALVRPGKLTVVSDLANPPFDYYDSANVPAGFEVELMQAVAQKMGLECEYLPAQKFDSIIPMIKQGGRADVGASNFTITDERLKEIDFTDAYIDSNQGIVTSSDIADTVASDYGSVLNVPGVSVAVQSGTTGESWAQENLPAASIKSLDDPVTALTGVQSGQFTAAIADLPVMQYEVKNSFSSLKVALQVPTGEQYGIVVSKDNPNLTAAVNEALEACTSDGTIDALEAKWFGNADASQITATAAMAGAAVDSSGTGAVAVSKATARPNESGGSGVIGGEGTRLTWEGTVHVDSGISSVTLTLPDKASFDGSSTRITVLEGLKRQGVDGSASANGNTLTVSFAKPVANGSLLRLEVTNMSFPDAGGSYVVTGSYTTGEGQTASLMDSSPIAVIANTPLQRVVNWLDGQACHRLGSRVLTHENLAAPPFARHCERIHQRLAWDPPLPADLHRLLWPSDAWCQHRQHDARHRRRRHQLLVLPGRDLSGRHPVHTAGTVRGGLVFGYDTSDDDGLDHPASDCSPRHPYRHE